MSKEGNQAGPLDSIVGKAQDALGKFMDDQEKVDKVKSKAENALAKKLGRQQAGRIVAQTESLLERFAHKPGEDPTHPTK